MKEDLESYLDTLAQYYDLSYPLTRDIDFFLEMAERFGDPILELGCGTGRLLLPLAEAGYKITGLDISSGMLNILKEKLATKSAEEVKRASLVHGDFQDYSLDEEFRFIFIAFNTFYHSLTLEDQESTLRSAHKHLQDEGRLCIAVFNPNLDYITSTKQGALTHDFTYHDEERGLTLSRFSVSTFQPFKQLLDVDFIYDVIEGGNKFERHLVHFQLRYLFYNELHILLKNCGFVVEEEYGDYDKSPLAEGCPQLIFVARKA